MTDRDLAVTMAAAGAWCGVLGHRAASAWGGGSQSAAWLVAVLVVAVAVVVWRWSGPCRSRAATALLLIAVIGGAAGAVATQVRAVSDLRSPVHALATEHAASRAVLSVVDDPRPQRDGSGAPAADAKAIVSAQVRAIERDGQWWSTRARVVLIAPASWRALEAGSTVRATVQWTEPSGPDVVAFGSVRAAPTLLSEPSGVVAWANRVRAGLRDAAAHTDGDGARIMPALVLGDESAVPEDVTDDMRQSGLGHLSAVSGANVAFVLLAATLVARCAGVRGTWLMVTGLVVIVLFALVARLEPSVVRASVMAAIVLVGAARGGRARAAPALAAAVFVVVLIDPHLATSLGFVLSVVATVGLVLLAPILMAAGASTDGGRTARVKSGIRDAARVTLAAQLAVAPFLVAISGRVDVGGVAANLVAAPVVPVVTIVGFAAALLSLLHPVPAAIAAQVAAWPSTWIVVVAEQVAANRWARLPWPGGWLGGAVLVALVTVLMVGVAVWRSGRSARRTSAHHGLARRTLLGSVVVTMVAAAVLVAAPVDAERRWPPSGWHVVMCDVGQGDATVLAAGAHRGILIDAGPDAREVDRCLRDLGITELPLVVLTHFHADHVVGLPGVVRGRRVGSIVTTRVEEPAEAAATVRQIAERQHIPVGVASAGRAADVDGWRLEVLGPTAEISSGSVPNNASVVLHAEGPDLSILLLGDVEREAQEQLVRIAAPAIRDVDVLKVAHHGSAAQVSALSQLAAPALAMIGVGCDNRYGHPSRDVLELLNGLRATTGRTDRDGDLAVVGQHDSLRLIVRGPAASHGPASRCG